MSLVSNLDEDTLTREVEARIFSEEIPENIASSLNIPVEKVYAVMYEIMKRDDD